MLKYNKKHRDQLWEKIQNFQIDLPGSSLKFSDRLARENGWTRDFALRALEEYRKFMFLAVVSGHTVTPSEEVDQVWHLHLIYTESYWKDFCRDILEIEINHGPTKGGKAENDKFHNWYEKTKESYKIIFNEEPPLDIWPRTYYRFFPKDFRTVNVDAYYMIPKDLWISKLIKLFR